MGSLPGNPYDDYMLPKAIEQVTIWLSGQKLRQNWLKSSLSNALNAVLCGAGYNLQIDPAVIRFFCAWMLCFSTNKTNRWQAQSPEFSHLASL
mgnify:CR=1 FL=1